jgi:acetoin utilization protein AcuB
MLVENYIDHEIPVLKTSDTIRTAIKKMEEANLEQLPVIDQDIFQGILLRTTAENVFDNKLKLEGIQLETLNTKITPATHILEALKSASDAHLDVLGIVGNDQNKYAGSVKKSGLLDYFTQMHGIKAVGSILTISIPERDYSLHEIARIVEANGAKILAVFTDIRQDDPFNILVTLKINLTDLSRVISALQRHNFTIVYTFHQEEFQSAEKDRLDHLLRFLSI